MVRKAVIDKWVRYQSQTSSGKPRTLLIKALSYVSTRNAALELGAGALNETQYLLNSDFKEVIAIDITPQFKEMVVKEGVHFKYVENCFENYDFEADHFDLVSSQYSLPFINKGQFQIVWKGIEKSLKREGIFCGQLFGRKDDWSNSGLIIIHSREEVEKLAEDFEILLLEEKEEDSPTASGNLKHWHYFELILKKR